MVRQVLLLRRHQSRVSRKISSCVMVQAMEEMGIASIASVSTCCPRLGFISTSLLGSNTGYVAYQTIILKTPNWAHLSGFTLWELLWLCSTGPGVFRNQVNLLENTDLQNGLSQCDGQFIVAGDVEPGGGQGCDRYDQ